MRRLSLLFVLLLGAFADASAQDMRYSDWYISEFESLMGNLTGRDGVHDIKVPSIFKNKFRKEMVKNSAREEKRAAEAMRDIAEHFEDIYIISYDKCRKQLQDSVNRAMFNVLRPVPENYCRDSCYIYGCRRNPDSKTIEMIVMHIASQNTLICMTGTFRFAESGVQKQ